MKDFKKEIPPDVMFILQKGYRIIWPQIKEELKRRQNRKIGGISEEEFCRNLGKFGDISLGEFQGTVWRSETSSHLYSALGYNSETYQCSGGFSSHYGLETEKSRYLLGKKVPKVVFCVSYCPRKGYGEGCVSWSIREF